MWMWESPRGISNNQQRDLGQVILERASLSSAICPDTSRAMTQGAWDLHTWLPWPTLGFLEKLLDLCFFCYNWTLVTFEKPMRLRHSNISLKSRKHSFPRSLVCTSSLICTVMGRDVLIEYIAMPICGFIACGYISATGPELNGYKGNHIVRHAKMFILWLFPETS